MKRTTTSSTTTVQQIRTALLRRKEVEKLTALSRSRIYDLMKIGQFPRPVTLGVMSVAWLETEVHEWIADRIADRSTAA
ncbi:MAG: AlpA family transcriptional regulator [Nitrosomonadales bacterium]